MANHDEDSVKLALLAHDLRTPLAAMRLTAELIGTGPLNGTQKEQLSILIRSIDALTQMTGELVTAAEPGSHGELTPARIADVVTEIADLFKVAAEAKNLTLTLEIDGEAGEAVTPSGGTLRRVIMTLLDNAVKYTAEGGVTVQVQASGGGPDDMLGPDVAPDDDPGEAKPSSILISVSDSGPGIEPEEGARLFRPFVRGRHGRETAPGTGLGLWGTAQFVRDMNGRLTLERSETGGSRFNVEIPLHADDEDLLRAEGLASGASAATANASPTGPLSAHVLIVDDNETNCRLLAALLESFGISSEAARSGEQAIGLVQKTDFDAALLDLHMPGMSGVETAVALRSLRPDLPLIAVTAALESVGDKRLREAGFRETLTKPLSPAALFEAMKQASRHKVG
ncbi:response regulator [Roseibium sp. FZY0029]|uniref:hybrid sensor histidine kinase/response regulator n=1 Tax=Roseibium sp. FZY0029 TaxID=3116647 RepID=UPI002EC4DCCB|nr:response regulator [Roseibium sp. FZY0029]